MCSQGTPRTHREPRWALCRKHTCCTLCSRSPTRHWVHMGGTCPRLQRSGQGSTVYTKWRCHLTRSRGRRAGIDLGLAQLGRCLAGTPRSLNPDHTCLRRIVCTRRPQVVPKPQGCTPQASRKPFDGPCRILLRGHKKRCNGPCFPVSRRHKSQCTITRRTGA